MKKHEYIDDLATLITEEQRIVLEQASHRSVRRFHRAITIYAGTYSQVLDEVFARQVKASRRQVALDRTVRKVFGADAAPLARTRLEVVQ